MRDAADPLTAAKESGAAAGLRLARSFREPGQHSVLVGRDAVSADEV